ncbi:Na/Pi cotransporter family protein [Methylobacterium nonmethylotrophicum]|uniref:Na/Pi cotransporter family protein n=1 Tax=Methylobacterium nonmethylotrophicum TaxID=1141884 RepID=A0A4Z0NEE3_9HYPH|nr:Na/Pi cotransporter family protein [Methylobacterium nonmethylotrophicum]TGD94302.1 Na/Pi cotransporter family protein [Methylobacterium nonmethylotrophicum]
MDTTLTLIDLCGAVALLLWGIHMVQTGVQRALGPQLRRVLGVALANRVKALAAGLGVTALLQSSTATGLIVASFAGSGLVALVPALAVMLGANIGTTLIVQVLSFDVARAAPVLVLVGVILFRRGSAPRTRDLGRAAIGLGLMLMALSRLIEVITPYEDVPALRVLLGAVATDRLVALVLGAVLTWAAHSSVATVLLVMSFTQGGVLPFEAGMALVLGANLGSALNPVLEGARDGEAAGRQVALGNLLTRALGCAAALPCLGLVGPLLVTWQPDLSRAVADAHTAFNLVLAGIALPLLGPFAALLRRMVPERIDAHDPGQPIHLDAAALETPPVALGAAGREALRMADVLAEMMGGAGEALTGGDRARVAQIRRMDDTLDRLNAAIKAYLIRLDPEALSEADERRIAALLAFTTNLEHAGDILSRNVMTHAAKRLKRGLAFSPDGAAEVGALLTRLQANLSAAGAAFLTEDPRAARRLADEKAVFRDLEARATEAHFRRLRAHGGAAGTPVPAEAAALYPDLVRDLKRVNDHLVAGAAYPVLESRGALRASRLEAP